MNNQNRQMLSFSDPNLGAFTWEPPQPIKTILFAQESLLGHLPPDRQNLARLGVEELQKQLAQAMQTRLLLLSQTLIVMFPERSSDIPLILNEIIEDDAGKVNQLLEIFKERMGG